MRSLPLALAVLLAAPACALAASAPDEGTAWSPEPKSVAQFRTKPPSADPATQKKVVEAGDGVDLFVETWLPDPLPGKVPTILVATPYVQEDRERYTTRNLAPLAEWFNARGYAVAQHHVRGTGNSGGCIEQTADKQIDDTARVIEYLGRDAPWSNGAVGMYGHSYDAETQISVAGRGDPEKIRYLKAIIPSATVGGQYEYSNFDGVPYVGNAVASNAAYLALTSLAPGSAPVNEHTLERLDCQGEVFAGSADPSGNMTPFWQVREYRPQAERITAATLWVHGLDDRNVQPITLAGFFDRLPASTPHVGMFGQWEHNYPDNHSGVEPEWARQDWMQVATAWYDQYLKGLDVGAGSWPPVQVQDSTGQWRSEPSFPQAGGPAGQLGLGAEGQLGVGAPSGSTTFTEDDESGENVVWTTDAMAAPLHLVGQPVLDLFLTTSLPDAHLAARLEVLGPDGGVLVHEGGEGEAHGTFGFRSLQHLDPMPENYFKQESGRLAPTGEPLRVPIRFHPNDLVVPAGGKLRVTLSGALSYSRTSMPSGGRSTITVHHECGKASALRFLMPHVEAPLLNVRETDEEGAALASAVKDAGRPDGGGVASARLCGEDPVRGEVLGPERSYPARAGQGECVVGARVTSMKARARKRRLRVTGAARSRCAKLAGVEVSLYRKVGRKCSYFTGRRFSRASSCRRFKFVRARGRGKWSLTATVPRGRYEVRARAYDAHGIRGGLRRAKVRVR